MRPLSSIFLFIAALLVNSYVYAAGDLEATNNEIRQLYDRGEYERATFLTKEALELTEKQFGPEHPDVASTLGYLANLYYLRGQYSQAEPLHKRAITIREKVFGANDPIVATSLNNLALVYKAKGKFQDALSLWRGSPKQTPSIGMVNVVQPR
jgi:tetratricopeptide (TPR) repeat protein